MDFEQAQQRAREMLDGESSIGWVGSQCRLLACARSRVRACDLNVIEKRSRSCEQRDRDLDRAQQVPKATLHISLQHALAPEHFRAHLDHVLCGRRIDAREESHTDVCT